MRFFFADAIPGLSLSRHELPQPWVLPPTLPRDHKDRLCALLVLALRAREPELSALQLTWFERMHLSSGVLRLGSATLVQWQLASNELGSDLPAHFRLLSELPPHLPLLDLDLPPSPRHVRFVEGHPGLGWLGTLKVALLDALQGYVAAAPTPHAEDLALLLDDLAVSLPSPVELLDCLHVLLTYDLQDLPLSEARTEALGRVFAARFVHALTGGLPWRRAFSALQALPAVLAQRKPATPAESASPVPLPDDLYHLLLAMGLHEGPPDADSHPACALLLDPAVLDRTGQRIEERLQDCAAEDPEGEPGGRLAEPAAAAPEAGDEDKPLLEVQPPAADGSASERALLSLLRNPASQPEQPVEGLPIALRILGELLAWDHEAPRDPQASERIAVAAEQAAESLGPLAAQRALVVAVRRWTQARQPARAEPALLRARALATGLTDPRQAAEAARLLGQALLDLGRPAEAQPLLEQARALFQQGRDKKEEPLSAGLLGLCLARQGSIDAARDMLQQALRQPAPLGDRVVVLARELGRLERWQLRLDSAASAARQVIHHISQARAVPFGPAPTAWAWELADASRLLAEVRLLQGRLAAADRWCENARRHGLAAGDLGGLAITLWIVGRIALRRGRSGEAQTAFLHVQALSAQVDSPLGDGNAHLGIAAVHLRSRRLEAAERELDQALARFAQKESIEGQAEALRGLALLARLRGSEWRDGLQRADALATSAHDLYGQGLGRLLRAVAEHDPAQLAEVREFFHARGMPYEAGIAAQLLASDAPTRWDDSLRTLPFF